MMKTTAAPRRLYSNKSIMHVCFDGQLFGVTGTTTKIDRTRPVHCEPAPSFGTKSQVKVRQLSASNGSVCWTTEVWPAVRF